MGRISKKKIKGGGLEIAINASSHTNEDPDNPDNEQMARYCPTKGKHILNPIIDWTTDEVWEFIHEFNIPYCKLYDEGYKRLGCIGCPMGAIKHREAEFERYPKFKQAYIRAFDRMIAERSRGGIQTQSRQEQNCTKHGSETKSEGHGDDGRREVSVLAEKQMNWSTGEDVMKWWIR